MLQCTTEQAWIVYRWTFNKILPNLPGPGTKAFAGLVRDLKPFSLVPAGISLDAPTSSLEDVNLRFHLLDSERGVLRFCYGFFEFAISYVSEGDDKAISDIVTAAFRSLLEVDEESKQGRSQVTLRAHVKLAASDPETFLREHLSATQNQEHLVPDYFYYNVSLDESSQASRMRIGVAKSLQFDNALFVEVVGYYTIPADTDLAGDEFANDVKRGLSLLGLDLHSKVKEST
jgi:hypothetical protein